MTIGLKLGGMIIRARLEDLPGPPAVEPHAERFLDDGQPDLDLLFRPGSLPETEAELWFERRGRRRVQGD